MHGQYATIGDTKLYYEIEGQGLPMVLINGGPGGNHHYFHPWFNRVSTFSKLIYYDQRGTGLSGFEKGEGFTFKQAVDDLEKLRIELGIKQWVVLGHSYGGALAQYYTATHPERVLGMVLISSGALLNAVSFNQEPSPYISEIELDKRRDVIRAFFAEKLDMSHFLYNLALNGDWKRQNYFKPSQDEMIRSALYGWDNAKDFNPIMNDSYGAYNFKGLFDTMPIPTFISEGKWDFTWTNNKAKLFKENHPMAQHVLFEEAAHSIFNEAPELFFTALEKFISELKPISEQQIKLWKTHANSILKTQEKIISGD